MYKIYVDNVLICSSKADDTAVINPVVILEANRAGSFTFTLPRDHPFYGEIEQRKSMIDVVQDGETIFEGIATEIKDDFYGQREISCEGELTFLNDTIQRPARYQDRTPAQLLTAFIAAHNAQVESSKQFTVGSVTAEDPNDSIYCYTNYENTMKCIGDDLLDDIGGYLRIRHENGVRILDYLAESPHTNTQVIAIGKNMIDLIKNVDTLDLCTVLIPLGNRLETQTIPDLEDRLTIESVNEGLDYLENAAAIQTFGRITKTVIWDDVGIAENLKTKGQDYLTNAQYAHMVIEATAFDLGLATDVFEKFRLLDMVRVVSEPHGLDRNFMITKLTLNLNAPENNKITLGDDTVVKISAKTSQALDRITQQTDQAVSTAVQAAVANATALITSALGGYVVKTRNELFIMDTADPETAAKVWRWNLNGLGYSDSGINGPYIAAMTMDGVLQGIQIIGERGSIGGWGMDTQKISKSGSYDVNDINSLTMAYINAVIMGRQTEEEVLRVHPQADINKDGHIDIFDMVLCMVVIMNMIPSKSGSFESSLKGVNAFSLYEAKANGKPLASAGIHGLFGTNLMGHHIIAVNDDGTYAGSAEMGVYAGESQIHGRVSVDGSENAVSYTKGNVPNGMNLHNGPFRKIVSFHTRMELDENSLRFYNASGSLVGSYSASHSSIDKTSSTPTSFGGSNNTSSSWSGGGSVTPSAGLYYIHAEAVTNGDYASTHFGVRILVGGSVKSQQLLHENTNGSVSGSETTLSCDWVTYLNGSQAVQVQCRHGAAGCAHATGYYLKIY